MPRVPGTRFTACQVGSYFLRSDDRWQATSSEAILLSGIPKRECPGNDSEESDIGDQLEGQGNGTTAPEGA